MSLKTSLDIEIQPRESIDSKEICDQVKILTEGWDAPHNEENPRNWSACE
jgi:hypothetical protein